MRCNLKAVPDVAPVILGFNYETINAPAYALNTSAAFLDSVTPISSQVQWRRQDVKAARSFPGQ